MSEKIHIRTMNEMKSCDQEKFLFKNKMFIRIVDQPHSTLHEFAHQIGLITQHLAFDSRSWTPKYSLANIY